MEWSHETATMERRPLAVEQPGEPAPQPPQPPEQPNEVPQPPSQPDEMPQLPDPPHPAGTPPTMRERDAGEKTAAPDSDERSHGEQYPGPADDAPAGDQYDEGSQRPPDDGAGEQPSPTR